MNNTLTVSTTAPGSHAGSFARGRTFLRRDPVGTVALLALLLLVLLSVFAPLVSPYDPDKPGPALISAPSLQHLAGTDQFGRDILSRVIYGGRESLSIGFGAAIVGGLGSLTLALVFTYIGGWADYLFQRVVDTVLALPYIIVLIVLVGTLGPSVASITLVLGVRIAIPGSRVIRSAVLSIKQQEYVSSALVTGSGPVRIVLRHVLPNVLPLAIVNTSLLVGFLILAEASLSFLGLGLPPPTPSWGGMMGLDGRAYLIQAPWMLIAPAIALSVAVLSANMLGDSVRDAMDPRVR